MAAILQRHVLFYAMAMALLVVLIKILETGFYMQSWSAEHVMGVVALIFTFVGTWIGVQWKRQGSRPFPVVDAEKEVNHVDAGEVNGLSNREREVLRLMMEGYSNQEIADRLYVTLSTVKTHASNIYEKLGVKRRTQAVKLAKERNLV